MQNLDQQDNEKYVKKDMRAHILLRPDTYIGDIDIITSHQSVFDGIYVKEKMVKCSPGLLSVFNEALSNSSDHVFRTIDLAGGDSTVERATTIRVTMAPGGEFTVYNNGDGIPVCMHEKHEMYIPEMIFGNLLTSSNYDDNQQRTYSGRNGLGIKLLNVFSTEFCIETVDHRRGKIYTQKWCDNMSSVETPAIKSCKKKSYTKLTFKVDLEKFGMKILSDDVINLIRRRVLDISAITPQNVSVYFNDVKLPVKNFLQYSKLFFFEKGVKFSHEKQDGWEVIACLSPDGVFHQNSLVNGVNTSIGGCHVDSVVSIICRKLISGTGKKTIKPQHIKNNLWVFVNCTISNPKFSTQTKTCLTTPSKEFGKSFIPSADFITKLEKTKILVRAESLRNFQVNNGLSRSTDGKKSRRVIVPKLEDANWAGTKRAAECTLILTEGDSAKAFVMGAMTVIGRDSYGVFPLKGKVLNVFDATDEKMSKNKEFCSIKKIIGLKQGARYVNVSDLRYGKILILTDQDLDGSHIKGLIINMFGCLWKELVQNGFILSMLTPLIRVKSGGESLCFYTLSGYRQWRALHPRVKKENVKYYKGLGTNTRKEAIEIFQELKIYGYNWCKETESCLEMAFSKKKSDSRKEWLKSYDENNIIDYSAKIIDIADFINRELIHFSDYSNVRSIPCIMDGLKPGQRKILHYMIKHNITREIKVSQLVGPVSSETEYKHGEGSLEETIVGMAQDFVGSNNINLLCPQGQFGTRLLGGRDKAHSRYIFTFLEPITKLIFKTEDDALLNYLNEEGMDIEPEWFAPIIPMCLINGAHGIGTGYSTHIPSCHPCSVIKAVKQCISGETVDDLKPWYRGFSGDINQNGCKWITSGKWKQLSKTEVEIRELPIGIWSDAYTEYLDSLLYNRGEESATKKRAQCLVDYVKCNNHDDLNVHLILKFKHDVLETYMNVQRHFEEKFRLIETKSCIITNMYMFDHRGRIKKYDSFEEIIREFCAVRAPFYRRRRDYMLCAMRNEKEHDENRQRFIEMIVAGKLDIFKKSDDEIFSVLKELGFKKNPAARKVNVPPLDNYISGQEAMRRARKSCVMSIMDYDYLMEISVRQMTLARALQLKNRILKLKGNIQDLEQKTEYDIWNEELNQLSNTM